MTDHLQKHQWKKGESGNPAGRPKGSKNTATLLQQELTNELLSNKNLNKRAKKILNQCLELAENGDRQMIKFLLNKWLPDSGIAFGSDGDGKGDQPAITINIQSKEDEHVVIDNDGGEDG